MGHTGENIDINSKNILPDSPQQFCQSPEASLPQTNEYQLLDKQIEANQLQYKLSVGKNMPTVAVGGAYLYNNIMDKSQNSLIGLLTVSVPISSWWGGSHDMKRRKLQIINSQNDKQDKSELPIVSDLLDAQTLYQQSRDKYVESFTNYEVKKREYLQATGR